MTLSALNAFYEMYKLSHSPGYAYFIEHGLTESDHNKFESIDRTNASKFMPNIMISGDDIGFPNFYLKYDM